MVESHEELFDVSKLSKSSLRKYKVFYNLECEDNELA